MVQYWVFWETYTIAVLDGEGIVLIYANVVELIRSLIDVHFYYLLSLTFDRVVRCDYLLLYGCCHPSPYPNL